MTDLGPDARAALERFVVDNDELLRLEERIGRFNIFDALSITRVEIRHSNFLAWLLDPSESHGQSGLFLRAILMDLLRQSPPELRPFSPIQLDGADLRGVRVWRERRNIDILIECAEPRFVIAIENKIDSKEHSGQLGRYKKTVKELFGDAPTQFVYLTREGDEPSDEDWTPYTYRDIHDTLRRVRTGSAASIGDDVLTFLDHYLNLIGSRFMDDPQIDELCQTIYRNHRQAIDLIIERIDPVHMKILEPIEELVRSDKRWRVLYRGPSYVEFIPVEWDKLLPPLGKRKIVPANQWMTVLFRVSKRQCSNTVRIAPAKDSDLRRNIIERLIKKPGEFGLKSQYRNADLIGDAWATLGRINVQRWNPDDGPDEAKVLEKIGPVLDKRAKELAGVADALRPIIEQWQPASG